MSCLALSVENLSHSFGPVKVLDAVSLTVPPGSFTALLGLNGAGNTTLISLVTRLFDSHSGTIRVFEPLPVTRTVRSSASASLKFSPTSSASRKP